MSVRADLRFTPWVQRNGAFVLLDRQWGDVWELNRDENTARKFHPDMPRKRLVLTENPNNNDVPTEWRVELARMIKCCDAFDWSFEH